MCGLMLGIRGVCFGSEHAGRERLVDGYILALGAGILSRRSMGQVSLDVGRLRFWRNLDKEFWGLHARDSVSVV